MPDLPARRIDDRKLGPQLALTGEIVDDAPRVLPGFSQVGGQCLHCPESSE